MTSVSRAARTEGGLLTLSSGLPYVDQCQHGRKDGRQATYPELRTAVDECQQGRKKGEVAGTLLGLGAVRVQQQMQPA